MLNKCIQPLEELNNMIGLKKRNIKIAASENRCFLPVFLFRFLNFLYPFNSKGLSYFSTLIECPILSRLVSR